MKEGVNFELSAANHVHIDSYRQIPLSVLNYLQYLPTPTTIRPLAMFSQTGLRSFTFFTDAGTCRIQRIYKASIDWVFLFTCKQT
jgi:hypothetical protein